MDWPFSRIIGHIVGLSETLPVAKMFFSYPWLIYSFEPEKHSKQTQQTFYCLNGKTRLQPIHGSFITPSPAYCWGLNGLVIFQQVCYFRTNGNFGAQLFSMSCTKKTSQISVYLYFIWPIILFQRILSHYLIFPRVFFFIISTFLIYRWPFQDSSPARSLSSVSTQPMRRKPQ